MKKNERKKFAANYQELFEPLLRYAYYRVNNISLAEEITQEAFLKAWLFVNKKPNKIVDFKNFLYRVTKNLIIDFYKQKKDKEVSLELVSQADLSKKINLEEIIDNKIKHKLLLESIKRLDKRYRKVFVYRYVEDKSIEDICNKTGLSPNYVSVLIYKGLKILKEIAKEKILV